MKERNFVKDSINRVAIEEFLKTELAKAGYSHSDIQRTPLATRIVVFAQKPGMIIGKGGRAIDHITHALKIKFNLDNPQLDVQEIENPYIDANIVAKQIVAAIERGLNYKRVANLTLQKVMDSGAVGIAMRISGKLGGERGRTEKFSAGYLKFAGEPAEKSVRTAYATAQVKLGKIGIQVRILVEKPNELEIVDKIIKGDIRGNNKEKTNK